MLYTSLYSDDSRAGIQGGIVYNYSVVMEL